jgi:DNA (cytosine-5)-methyltransferase 1
MSRPTCLDLFCGAGGAGHGYYLAGFDVTGVDNRPQKRYPYKFILADALEYVAAHGHEYDFIHASPPCQFGSVQTPAEQRHLHKNLIPQTRELVRTLGKPYIIENVAGSREHLINPVMLCGSMFGLEVLRHRYFENSFGLFQSPAGCAHYSDPVIVTGMTKKLRDGKRPQNTAEEKRQAMGTPWMTEKEVTQAIPQLTQNILARKS